MGVRGGGGGKLCYHCISWLWLAPSSFAGDRERKEQVVPSSLSPCWFLFTFQAGTGTSQAPNMAAQVLL